METLLRHLQEHQEEISKYYEMDTEDINGTEGIIMPQQQQRKYVSIFRIDGEPIIPPLMTSEKIRQMQKFKEKAMRIEQRLKERKLRLNKKENIDFSADGLSERSSITTATTGGDGLSQRSQDYYDAKLKESEESMMILKDIIRRQSAQGCETREGVLNSSYKMDNNSSPRRCNEDKLKKLQKSETLIYDNSTNEVIKQIQRLEDSNTTHGEDETCQQNESERQANLNYIQPKKPPSQLLLIGLNDTAKCIPSICINPPTPLVGNRQICEPPAATGSNDTFFVSNTKHISQNLPDDSSSDDSFNSMFTHSDKKPKPPPVPERTYKLPRSEKIHDLKAYNNVVNVTAKIQQYEAISSDPSTPRTTPNSSPDKSERGQSKLGPLNNIISRSATSPSIKLNGTRPLTAPDNSHFSPDNSLIRSSSFTLEAPSKALIDHMRQQRSVSERPTNCGAIRITPPKTSSGDLTRKISPPSRIHRDTIESKAKRVQKVELKPSRQKIQHKVSQHKLAQAAAVASISPFKTNPSSLSTHGSTTNLYKSKKSPYDTKNYTKSSPSPQNSVKPSCQVRKSPPSSASSVSSQRTTKSRSSKPTTPTNPTVHHQKSSNSEKEAITQMDRKQKEKFIRLLKQQEEEQRKLKQAFEMQQKLLIEQLNKEMSATQIKSNPNESLGMLSTTRASSNLIQRSENLNESPSFSPDSTLRQEYSQRSSNFSNDSSLMSTTANNAYNTSDCPQVPPLAISNLSSMDHSNANTSLDQSTYRTDTLSDDVVTTPRGNDHNSAGSTSANSASRRRLFPQEHMTTATSTSSTMDVSMRAINSFSPNNRNLSDSQDPHQMSNSNKGYVDLTNSANSNRRPIEQINQLHAAATIINAYARGFLVRRLFKTEQIQRIVQTIHDTLVFVLNLHIETCENPDEANTPANIKLKARLLQQLQSATHTLHVVLFQTSVKERMGIIARDRKRIKHKLLVTNRNSSSRRTPRIAV